MTISKPLPETFLLESAGDPKIFTQTWAGSLGALPGDTSRELLIIHGMGEHSSRYDSVIEGLGSSFNRIVAFDLRGHGRSSGIRGHVDSFDDFLSDVGRVLRWMKESSKGKKQNVFLYAHSMGSLIGLRFLQKFAGQFPELKAAVLSSPFLGIRLAVPKWKTLAAKVLVRTLDRLQLSNEINPSYISHDSRVVADYVKDRLVHNKCTPRLYFELLKAHEDVYKDAVIPIPVLFLVPMADELVDAEKALSFIEDQLGKVSSKKQFTVQKYPGFYHEAHHEIKKDQVFRDVRNWMEQSGGGLI